MAVTCPQDGIVKAYLASNETNRLLSLLPEMLVVEGVCLQILVLSQHRVGIAIW